jgi:hypothetical protein
MILVFDFSQLYISLRTFIAFIRQTYGRLVLFSNNVSLILLYVQTVPYVL